jgi:Tfp pilus assembly protein PilF
MSEWVISKNLRPEKNIADDYLGMLQSNAGRLDSLNQTIKKYNQAYTYCTQDSRDLAVIQLKKVLSLNPRFIRAHQLLALLYMDS